MDYDRVGLLGTVELPGQGVAVVAVLRKVAFFSRKAALVAKNEANCCWWDSNDHLAFVPMTTIVFQHRIKTGREGFSHLTV